MRQARGKGAACALPRPSRRKPATGRPVVSKAAAPEMALPRAGPDAALLALLLKLRRQSDDITAIDEEGRSLAAGITAASRDQQRRLERVLDRRAATLERVIRTRASTPSGLRVKAEALALVALAYGVLLTDEAAEEIGANGTAWDRLALSLARDVLAWGIAA